MLGGQIAAVQNSIGEKEQQIGVMQTQITDKQTQIEQKQNEIDDQWDAFLKSTWLPCRNCGTAAAWPCSVR